MKIYVVTQGKYSDMDVIGVCDDLGKIPKGILPQPDVIVQTWEVNDFPPIGEGENPYAVWLHPKESHHDAEIVPIGTFLTEETWVNEEGHAYLHVVARNEAEAICLAKQQRDALQAVGE